VETWVPAYTVAESKKHSILHLGLILEYIFTAYLVILFHFIMIYTFSGSKELVTDFRSQIIPSVPLDLINFQLVSMYCTFIPGI
jgi:hypothetical protein